MATKPPFILHQAKHQYPQPIENPSTTPHTRLPVIPDLRFEYSYLRSIQPYVKIHPSSQEKSGSNEELRKGEYESLDVTEGKESKIHEIIDIQWGRVIWVTTRDQVISPLLQGALWALASYFLTPLSAELGTRIGTYAKSRLSPAREGPGVGWLRSWANGLGFGTSVPNNRRL